MAFHSAPYSCVPYKCYNLSVIVLDGSELGSLSLRCWYFFAEFTVHVFVQYLQVRCVIVRLLATIMYEHLCVCVLSPTFCIQSPISKKNIGDRVTVFVNSNKLRTLSGPLEMYGAQCVGMLASDIYTYISGRLHSSHIPIYLRATRTLHANDIYQR